MGNDKNILTEENSSKVKIRINYIKYYFSKKNTEKLGLSYQILCPINTEQLKDYLAISD